MCAHENNGIVQGTPGTMLNEVIGTYLSSFLRRGTTLATGVTPRDIVAHTID